MRGIKLLRLFLASVLVLVFILIFGDKTGAQNTEWPNYGGLKNLKIEFEVMPDSSIKVEQIFDELNLNQSNLIWQLDAKEIKDLKISENGVQIPSSAVNVQKGDLTKINFPLSYYSKTNIKITYQAFDVLVTKDEKIFLKIIIFDRPNLNISNLEVNLILPEDTREAIKYQRFYAIHGIESSSKNFKTQNSLLFSAKNASSYSSYTIEDSFFCKSVHFSLKKRIRFFFDNLSGAALFLLSLPLPLVTLLILFYLETRYKKSIRLRKGLKPSSKIPEGIPPALLGLLYEGEITKAGISSTILDLIKRGVVIIVDKGELITFGRKSSNAPILPYEEKILNQLFKRQKIKATLSELQKIEQEELIDPIFEKVYQEIYQIGANKGFFVRDPYRFKLIHHLTGIGIFVLSIIFYISVIIFFPANPLMLLPPLGVTISSLLILYLAKTIPPRTPSGKNELERWLSFKKYLLGHQPISEEKNLAINYLPQAEALRATEEWISHFKNLSLQTPDFYISAMPYVATSEWMIKTVNACREIAGEIERLKGY